MIHLYTDGGCEPNPGTGAWAAVFPGMAELSGRVENTTNNRMEMTAVIRGLEHTAPGSNVTVFSDSQYVINTMTKGWRRKMNHELWDELDRLVADRNVTWEWVKGHAGNRWNERCDKLCTEALNDR